MMAMMSGDPVVSLVSMNNAAAPCCGVPAHSFFAVTDRQSMDHPGANANSGNDGTLISVPIEQIRHEDVVINLRCGQRTQAILSTFLI